MRISDWSSDVCSSDLLRTALEKIGYTVELRGKHGTFEIVGVPKAAREEFSQRREDILNKAAETGITSHKGRDQITINTRDPSSTSRIAARSGKAGSSGPLRSVSTERTCARPRKRVLA